MPADKSGPRPYPRHTLEKALVIAAAIQEKNAGKPMNRILLAEAVGRTPGSSEYKLLLSSSVKYGLTQGTEKADQISITPLGQRVTKPISAEERRQAVREIISRTEPYGKIFEHYSNAKLPSGNFFRNTLERQFGIPSAFTQELEAHLVANGQYAGLLHEVSGSLYVTLEQDVGPDPLEDSTTPPGSTPSGSFESGASSGAPRASDPQPPPRPGKIFIAHGKNRHVLDQLKAILAQFKIDFQVAIDEPHKGRAISKKVEELMRTCTSGIFIFTSDEATSDEGGDRILRPSDNVVFELGAGSVLYGNKIVIFREEGVSFGSDFTEYGHITFEKDKLAERGLDLMKELVGLGFLKVTPS